MLLPEMTMLVLPACVNMAIILLKETAVMSVITVPELTLTISAIGTEFYAFVESLFLLALFYWGLVEICGWLGRIGEAQALSFQVRRVMNDPAIVVRGLSKRFGDTEVLHDIDLDRYRRAKRPA